MNGLANTWGGFQVMGRGLFKLLLPIALAALFYGGFEAAAPFGKAVLWAALLGWSDRIGEWSERALVAGWKAGRAALRG